MHILNEFCSHCFLEFKALSNPEILDPYSGRRRDIRMVRVVRSQRSKLVPTAMFPTHVLSYLAPIMLRTQGSSYAVHDVNLHFKSP